MVSANSWSLIEGSEIFFTITECPLTAVATAFVLIWFSRNSFEMALETVPESTIIESTTMSDESGSRPRCATSICPPFFFSSTALMLEEPTSRPTMDFDPNPNMCPPFWGRGWLSAPIVVAPDSSGLNSLLRSRSLPRCLGLAPGSRLHLARLLFHPLIQLRFLEAPAIAELKRGNPLFADVLVKRVRTHAQILRRLANIHHFSRVGHSSLTVSTRSSPASIPVVAGFARRLPHPLHRLRGLSVSRAYISLEKPQLEANLRVFQGFLPFSWNWASAGSSEFLYIVLVGYKCAIYSGVLAGHYGSLANW